MTLSDLDVAWMGLIADEQPAMYKVLETAGLTHGKGMQSYLCMMAVRLLQMRRVLKDAGSIYLHCDPTASHYLKLLMDAIFGAALFKAEINWQRTSAHSDSRTFGNVSDKILFYSTSRINADAIRLPLDLEYVKSHYRYSDERGRYGDFDLTGPGISEGESGRPWHQYDPGTIGRCWSVPRTGRYADWIGHSLIPGYKDIESVLERLDALEQANILIHTKNGRVPRLKRYLEASPGQVPSNNWIDIPPINSQAKERIGYPHPETAGVARAHHQSIVQRGRRRAGPLLRLRYGLRRCREPEPGAGSALTSRPRPSSWSTCACSSPWATCSTTGWLRRAPTSPGAPTSTLQCRTGRTSTSCSVSKKADVTAVAASSRSASSRSTTSSPAAAVARTTSRNLQLLCAHCNPGQGRSATGIPSGQAA